MKQEIPLTMFARTPLVRQTSLVDIPDTKIFGSMPVSSQSLVLYKIQTSFVIYQDQTSLVDIQDPYTFCYLSLYCKLLYLVYYE